MVSVVTNSYKTKFIDSARSMENSLSNVADNFTEGIHEIKQRNCDSFLKYESVKDHLVTYKWLSFNKDYSYKLMGEELKKRLKNNSSFIITISTNLFCS